MFVFSEHLVVRVFRHHRYGAGRPGKSPSVVVRTKAYDRQAMKIHVIKAVVFSPDPKKFLLESVY
jgi:hypothetical protein